MKEIKGGEAESKTGKKSSSIKISRYLLLFILAPLFSFAGTADGFKITGIIKGLETGGVKLSYRNREGEDTTITAVINSGKFNLEGSVDEPQLARFSITSAWQYDISFFLENSTIIFRLVKNADDSTQISGSASNMVYRYLEPQQRGFFAQAREYEAFHQQAKNEGNKSLEKGVDSIWASKQQQWMHAIRSAIKPQPKNYAGLYFIQWLLLHPPPYDSIMSLFMSLDASVRNGFAGKNFKADFEHYRRTAIGQPAPEISGRDTSGNPQTLAKLKGKIVLLDFWASYCSRCRQENPQLKQVYEKYHLAGFEILSFSLDYERPAWINAIQHDKLNWPQATELRAGASASAGVYDVQDMPRNFLLDRKGNIIAKDLSPEDLNEKLAELTHKTGN